MKQVESKRPSIAENDLYKKAMATLPAGVQPLSIAYSNPAKTYPELRRLALGLLPFARANGVNLPATLLPDGDDVGPFMTPGAHISWMDADGLHMVGHSAFPGADIIGGNPGGGPTMVAATAVATAVALPALGRARESARRVADAANVRGICMFCIMSASQNNDQLPESLARLIADGTMDLRYITSPRTGHPPFALTPELRQMATDNFARFADQIAQESDYVYVGKNMTTSQPNGSEIIIAYGKSGAATRDGMNVAFLDGHVEFMSMRNLPERFAPTNEFLKSKGLPTIDTDAIVRNAGANVPAPAAPTPGRPGGLP